MSDPHITVVRTPEEFRSLEPEWNVLHAEAGGTVFQEFRWLWNWWKVYGGGRNELHIVIARFDGRPTAILPLYRQSLGFYPFSLSRLRLIGVYETYGEYALLMGRRFTHESTRAIARHLTGMLPGREADLISFFRFSPESPQMDLLLRELRIAGLRMRYVPRVIVRVVMDLPGTWEEYLSRLSASERHSLRRRMRQCEKGGAVIERITSPDEAAFGDYVRLHTETWRARRIRGYFSSPRFREFIRTTSDGMMREGKCRLYFMAKDRERFAAVHAFFVNGTCCFYLSGLDRSHPMIPHSPGKVLLAHVIRDAIAEGCTMFDFQGGDEDYKFQLGGRGTSFAKAFVWQAGLRSAKVLAFLTLQYIYSDLRWRTREEFAPFFKSLLGARAAGPAEPGQGAG